MEPEKTVPSSCNTKMSAIEVLQTSGLRPGDPDSNYNGLRGPGTEYFPKGHRTSPDRAEFQANTILDRDITIPMRDGINLRADVFRPRHDEKVPVILAWSPYGKTGTGFFSLDLTPGRAGVPKSRTSGFEKFQGPDPAEWTARGYAICNVDARGVFDSEGDIRWFGTDEGRDGYDTVEYLATLPWCNGSVTMTGNSWLTVTQWFVAAEQPPHLKCIAPLEGASDTYRELAARGGPPALGFLRIIQGKLYGRHQREDLVTMIQRYPLWNEYWEDKRAKMGNIKIPAYIVASYSSGIHSEGTLRGYEESQGPKWLRIHATQEWYDNYTKACNDELQAFFDRYTKGVENNWEATPKVRASILRFNETALVNQVFPAWPIPSTELRVLHLNTSRHTSQLTPQKASGPSQTYIADVPAQQAGNDTEELQFEYTFDATSYVIGYPSATLYMSCDDHDDMDVYVQLRKLDRTGKLVEHLNIPPDDLGIPAEEIPNINPLKYLGPQGILRASHRGLDPELSKPEHLVLSHKAINKVRAGDVVKMEIPIWPCGIGFEAGEMLVLKISGHDMRLAEFTALAGTFQSENKGVHRVYCGEEGHYSQLMIPVVKP